MVQSGQAVAFVLPLEKLYHVRVEDGHTVWLCVCLGGTFSALFGCHLRPLVPLWGPLKTEEV